MEMRTQPGYVADNTMYNRPVQPNPIFQQPKPLQPTPPKNPIVGAPVYTPMANPVTTQNTASTTNSGKPNVNLGGSSNLNAYRSEEIRRKAENGEALQSATPEKQQLYDYYKQHYENLVKQKAAAGQGLTSQNPWKMGVYQNELTNIHTNEVQNELQKQIDAYNAQLARAQQANASAVNSNNAYLQEQISNFQKQKAVTDNQSQMLANRRGGFYSGGLDYQLGQNASSFNEQTGALQRDVGRQNADINNRNALMAEEIAKQIQLQQQQAPDLIRQRVQQQLDKLYDRSVTEAGLTGKFNGQNTMDLNNLLFNQGVTQAGLTGMYNGAPTLDALNASRQFGLQEAGLTGMFNGKPTLDAQNQFWNQNFQKEQFDWNRSQDQFNNQKWQAEFNEDRNRFGIEFALQKQVQLGNLSIDQARLALSQQEFGLSQDKFTFDQRLAEAKANEQPAVDINKYTGQLNKAYLKKDVDGNYVLPEKDSKEEQSLYRSIIGLNLDDQSTLQLLSMYGFDVSGFLQP